MRDRETMDLFQQAEEVSRRSTQLTRILDRLREGRATGAELAEVGGFRYGARLHELRRRGFHIELVEQDRRNGRTVYELQDERGE